MIEVLRIIFCVCIAVGIIIPLLDVLFGFIGSVFDIDFDIAGHPIGDVFNFGTDNSVDTDSPLPINIMCLCFSFVVFGAVGRLISRFMVNIYSTIGFLIALILTSAAAYHFLYKYVVKPLKKSNPVVMKQWDLFAKKGRLTLRITDDCPGVVSLKDSTGAMISYRAYAKKDVLENWEGEIPTGTEVIVVDIDPGLKMTYIKPLDTFQNLKIKTEEH